MDFGFIRGAKFLLARYPKHSILFENMSSQKDGYGAQIQRILSVKSLANAVNQSFVFNPLTEVEDQITQKALSREAKNEEISQFNSWLRDLLDSYSETANSIYTIIEINSPLELFYQSLRFSLFLRTKPIKVKFRMENAYFITNANPDLYLSVIPPKNHAKADSSKLKEIHVHVRFVNFSIATFRSLNSQYYFETLDRVTSNLEKAKIDFRIILHSDFNASFDDTKDIQITQTTKNHLIEMHLIDSKNMVDKDVLDSASNLLNTILSRYRNVEFSTSEAPLSSLQSMISADFLILSKSSFAFVAGILNPTGEIYSPEYWVNLPSSWITESGF